MIKFALAVVALLSIVHASEQDKIIAKLKQAPAHTPILPKVLAVSQAQLKYTLSTVEYYLSWVDRPLFIDPALADANRVWHYRKLNDRKDLCRRLEILGDYGYDGFVFFHNNQPQENAANAEYASSSGKKLIPIVAGTPKMITDALESAEKSPVRYLFNGKTVVFFRGKYPKDDMKFAKMRDRFIMISHITPPWPAWQRYYRDAMTNEDVDQIRNMVRSALRNFDGLHWFEHGQKIDRGMKYIAMDFHGQVLMPAAREVYAEAEFKGKKILGGHIFIGHENAYAYGYYMASGGLKTLIESYQIALDNKTDYLYQAEWDEQNENTSLRPTVFNGRTYMRISRYYTSKARHTPYLGMLSGDDVSIPNLSLSFRKILTVGERLELQLFNLPGKGKVEVEVALKSASGKVLYSSGKISFAGQDGELKTIELPSEKFAGELVLIPELTYTYGSKKVNVGEGFGFITLRAVANNDFKWVHSHLRDLLTNVKYTLKEKPSSEVGIRRFKAEFSVADKLAAAELTEANMTTFALSPEENATRENDDFWAIRIMNFGIKPLDEVKGAVSIVNGKMQSKVFYPVWTRQFAGENSCGELKIDRFSMWTSSIVLMIPKKASSLAVLKFDFPGILEAKLPLAEVLKKKSITLTGKNGVSIGVSRQLRQLNHVKKLDKNSGEFEINIMPVSPEVPIALQLIGMDGKIFRSNPIVFPVEKLKKIRVYSESSGKMVDAAVPTCEIDDVTAQYHSEFGAQIPTGDDRRKWAVRGGFTETTQFHGGNDGSYGNLLGNWMIHNGNHRRRPQIMEDFAPEIGNDKSWIFDGKVKHVQFSQEVIPRRADYLISFRIKPENDNAVILDATPYFYNYPIWRLALRNNEIIFYHNNQPYPTGVKLPANEYSTVAFLHRRMDSITLTVNGKSKTISCRGEKPQLEISPLTIGGLPPKDFFCGRIADFQIKVRL